MQWSAAPLFAHAAQAADAAAAIAAALEAQLDLVHVAAGFCRELSAHAQARYSTKCVVIGHLAGKQPVHGGRLDAAPGEPPPRAAHGDAVLRRRLFSGGNDAM